ncbi:MAG TPA: NAD(P)-dependent alcohol dehydrogenase [Noviherbaspirillum sp.]
MYAYQLVPGTGIQGLERVKLPTRQPGPGEVRVRVRAVALNYRDLMIAGGSYGGGTSKPIIPGSDGAGEVVETGPGVTRFTTGDRVVTSFFPGWIDGPPTAGKTANALGGSAEGVLAEEIVLHEEALTRIPAHLDFTEAATLTCAGVTAWNAMFETGNLKAGDTVLLLGTGGVSIWALQLAKAAGVNAIITSSSDDKLERARSLGAAGTINYKTTPEWQQEVMRLTGGRGADLVLEVGGQGTLARSIAATRMGGRVAVIGGVGGGTGGGFASELQLLHLIGGARTLAGIYVGSRSMLEQLVRCVDTGNIRPVVDRVFAFDKAPDAYAWLQSAQHFGKVVIRVGE